MLISPDLFLDCIILLIHDNSIRHQNVVKELIALYENEIKSGTGNKEKDQIVAFYIRIAKMIIAGQLDPSNTNECRHQLLKIKSDPVLEKRRDLYDLLCDTFINREEMAKEKLEAIAQSIQNQLVWNRMNKVARNLFGGLTRSKDMVSVEDQTSSLRKLLVEIEEAVIVNSKDVESDHAAGMVDRVSFGDKDSMTAAIEKHEQRAVTGVIKTGLQGLNKFFGKEGGIALGESVVFNALSHNYKSGMLQSMAMWAALYNNPKVEGKKKPIVLMISLENEAFQNFIWISRKAYHQETGKDAADLDNQELIDWTDQRFAESGFRLEILRYLPDQFGYEELVALISHYESIGFCVYMVIIDYMNNMRKSADGKASGAGNHLAVKELYSKCCNYTKTKGATLVTAHQLNRKAQELANSGKSNAVKFFNSEHLADSMDVQREVDTSIYMHIEKNHEQFPFLTMYRNKRRYDDTTPEPDKFCAYPFLAGGIMDDINGPKGYVKDIFAWSIENIKGQEALAASYKAIEAGTATPAAAAAIF